MLVLMLISILMLQASMDIFVLSFVLPCAYGYVDYSEFESVKVFTHTVQYMI